MKLALFFVMIGLGVWRGWHTQWAEGAFWMVLALMLHPGWEKQ